MFQIIETIQYERQDIPTEVRHAVDAFGDGKTSGSYQHFVPVKWIARTIKNAVEGNMTRAGAYTWLSGRLATLGIADTSRILPATSTVAYDAWFGWAVDAICDWPPNIFRWKPSTGDADGNQLDVPVQAPTNLENRVFGARQALITAIGIPTQTTLVGVVADLM